MRKERNQYLSRPDVQAYLLKYPDVTPKEKRDLVKWLKAGGSPLTNDCDLWDDSCNPMDFIDARRTWMDLIQQQMSPTDEFHVTALDESPETPF